MAPEDDAPDHRQKLGALLRSVVKVMAVSDPPDYDQPWQTSGASPSVGSGVVVATARGPRILTNAHCVENAVFVEVRRYGLSRKHVAQVEAAGHACDLALLAVEDESFFSGVTPAEVGGLPHLGDAVSVCGYPVGGERLSITQGIVSRIDLVEYEQSHRQLLALQIDAAINSGNSGGPVYRGDELVGIAFQTLDEAENVGYVVAAPVVSHFLEDVARGATPVFPSLGALTQPLESRTHRAALGLVPDSERGVLVRRVAYGGSAWGVLAEGDVLLEVDGVPILPDGTVALRDGELVDFSYVFSRRHVGEACSLTIVRERVEHVVSLPLRPPADLVAEERYDVRPTYYVYAGLLFVPLTKNYLTTYSDPWWQNAPRDLMTLHERGVPTEDRREPVVLQKVLADRVNQGYHHLESILVRAVDGTKIRDLSHLVELVETAPGPYVEVEAADGTRIAIDRALADARGGAVLARYGVTSDRSPDLRAAPVSEAPAQAAS